MPVLCVLCAQMNLLKPPPSNKIPGYATAFYTVFITEITYSLIICLIDPKYYFDPSELGSKLLMYFISSFFHSDLFLPAHCSCRGLLLSLITLNDTHIHTYTFGRTVLDEGSAHCREVYLTKHKTHMREIFMTSGGFEPKIPAN